jgi:hypothetical protein
VANKADMTSRRLQAVLEALDEEIDGVEELVKQTERWEMRKVVRQVRN